MLKMHTYDLLFEDSNCSPLKAPTLGFAIAAANKEELDERLTRLAAQDEQRAAKYFEELVQFERPTQDLTGNSCFGYGNCSIASTVNDTLVLRIVVTPESLSSAVRNVHLLTEALTVPFEHTRGGYQQIDVDTICTNIVVGCGHAVTGHVYDDFVRWLVQYGKRFDTPRERYQLPQSVLAGMRDMEHILSKGFMIPLDGESYGGWITSSGQFVLRCIGDACDLSMDDEPHVGDESFGEFSCHNLDSAMQQMILLAGLATLYELALTERMKRNTLP